VKSALTEEKHGQKQGSKIFSAINPVAIMPELSQAAKRFGVRNDVQRYENPAQFVRLELESFSAVTGQRVTASDKMPPP
jgi:hypothetical protein